MPNPADTRGAEQAALGGVALGFFGDVRRSSSGRIQLAIRQGSIRPITTAPVWKAAHETAVARATPVQTDLAAFGLRSGLVEVPETQLVREVPGIAPGVGERRAVELIQAVDFRTRQAISVSVRSAARRYRQAPSARLLRDLAGEIRSLIGLTPWQLSQIKKRIRALQSAGFPPDVVRAQTLPLIDRLLDLRAKAIADRAVIETVSEMRYRGWIMAQDAGEIPDSAMKVWRNPLDGRERARHRAQALMPPIPLKQPFPIFGVQFAPAPEAGCRCWNQLALLPDFGVEIPP